MLHYYQTRLTRDEMMSYLPNFFAHIFLDPYNRKARLQPILLSFLPVLVVSLLLIPELHTVWGAIGGLVLYCGMSTLLMQLGRQMGKKKEPNLFRVWNGKPSVAMLRHQDSNINRVTKSRYRTFLETNISDLRLASPKEEQECPSSADEGYQSATDWLLVQTRNRERFRMIYQENINYGFRRNVWALKPHVITIDVILIAGLFVIFGGLWTEYFPLALQIPPIQLLTSIVICTLHFLVYVIVVTPKWVYSVAQEYAKQLLSACDELIKQK